MLEYSSSQWMASGFWRWLQVGKVSVFFKRPPTGSLTMDLLESNNCWWKTPDSKSMQRQRACIWLNNLYAGISWFRNETPGGRTLGARFYRQGNSREGCVPFYLDWLALSLGFWLILQLVRLWRLPRGLLTHSSYLFLLEARWLLVLELAACDCGWLTTGSWIWVLHFWETET